MNSHHTVSRRQVLKGGAGLGLGSMAFGLGVAPKAFGSQANKRLNVAAVGVGGRGRADLEEVAGGAHVNIAALCDVDAKMLGEAAQRYSAAAKFVDWRRMLDNAKDIDAVLISTPDHMHAPIALAAMQLGKHVYVQKPLAHNLAELKAMDEMAARTGVVTQMGNQIHSHTAYLTAVHMIQQGVIGRVSEAHLWVGKSWAGAVAGRPNRQDEVPAHLDWDLWLGVAPERPFVTKLYHRAAWRGWRDFGGGTLGDMGCHIYDPVIDSLGLGAPLTVTWNGTRHNYETYTANSDVSYTFAGTQFTDGEVKLRWTDGNSSSVVPDASRAQLPKGVSLPWAGSFMVGEKGVMVLPHIGMPVFYRNGEVLEIELDEQPGKNHYHEWTDACRGEDKTSMAFARSVPITSAVLCGVVAGEFPQRTLAWDAASLSFDYEPASALVGRDYRKGWRPAGM